MGGALLVKLYVDENVESTLMVSDVSKVVPAVEQLMVQKQVELGRKLGKCRVRFEDERGSGGWLLIGAPDGKSAL